MNKEEKDSKAKYLKEEEFNIELEQQVDSVLRIFEDYNKRKKDEAKKDKDEESR